MFAIALLAIAITIYIAPTLIAANRQISGFGALMIVNVVFGWTVLGWIVCLIWATNGRTAAQDAFYQEQMRGRPH